MRILAACSVIATGGLLLSACATVTRGTTDTLLVQSEPTGAEVELSSGQTCRTPCSLELKRKHDILVMLRKEGFEDARMAVASEVAGAGAAGMAGNVLVGGIIGIGVDAATGAGRSLRPNPVHVHLVAHNPEDADRLCGAPDSVAGSICRGRLKVGATPVEVEALLGLPQQRGKDDREWQYGHDTLVFDESGRFASTSVEK